MSNKIFRKFVAEGITKNKKIVLPFLVAGTIIVMIFNILASLAYTPYIYHDGIEAFYGAQILSRLLEISFKVVGFFSVIFILYANNFVMKNRRKEIGLYGVLGLSKKNIAIILIGDMLVKAFITIVCGLILGTFLNKLMLLALYKIIHQPPVSGLMLEPKSIIITAVLFSIIYLVCLISNIMSVNICNPIELLRSDKSGEKEPKVKVLMFIAGLAALGCGYFIALKAKSTMDAIQSLFMSIILVIAATYLLFTAGSIFILKKLKNNKKYYYKTRNFISVSNLIYRMKHNAAGLASICVLSTGVLILLTSAASLQILGNKSIDTLYPNDIKIEIYDDNSLSDEECISGIESIAEKQNESVVNGKVLRYNSALWVKSGNTFSAEESAALVGVNDVADMYLLSLDNYNKYFGTDVKLDKDQVLAYSTKNDLSGELNILDKKFSITGEVPEADRDKLDKIINPAMRLYESVVIVFDSDETIKSLTTLDKSSAPRMYICFDTQREWSAKKVAAFTKDVNEYLRSGLDPSKNESYYVEVKFKQEEKAFFYNLYGGAFFVGLFLAVVFLMATALIIYYKQLSEGYEDKERYRILSCVGLTDKEIKQTIKQQVKLIFFLPLVTAIIHMAVASKIIKLFLGSVIIVDTFTFICSMVIVSLVFAVFYAIVYKFTSIQYYKIVNSNN